jgi:class 3 adenylate cyclase/tetratricopeptide (TPR) repeat protein
VEDQRKKGADVLPQALTYTNSTSSIAARYLPSLLLDKFCRLDDLKSPWIESVEGSLLFADISGFTSMSERLAQIGKEGAERLTDIINAYFDRMLDIAGLLGGDNIKFGGDALLLLFSGENHAGRAVSAARQMVHSTSEFKSVRIGKDRFRLNMSAGVHSGIFWSTSAGLADVRMQHFLLGQEASRVAVTESRAEAGEVIITSVTRDLLGDRYILEEKGEFFKVTGLPDHTGCTTIRTGESQYVFSPNIFAYLPPPIALLLDSGDEIPAIEGEHRKVTVQFINVLGVNELLESAGPDALLAHLQRYVSAVVELTVKHKGFLIGSDIDVHGLKLILAFGAPIAHEYDSASALRLALGLNAELLQLKLPLRHRIGIHTGFVFTGEVGSHLRHDYTVMGDAVNLAARIMGKASPGQILVSRRLAEEVGPAFKVRQLRPMKMKGKKEPVPVSELEGEVADMSVQETQVKAFFGRKSELDSLIQTSISAETGNARFIVVDGGEGIGKGVLLNKFQDVLIERGWSVYRGQCNSYSSSDPLVPWISILNSFFDISPADDSKIRTSKLTTTIGESAPELLETASLFNGLLSLSIPETDIVRSLDEEGRRLHLFNMVTDLLKIAASRKPLAIVIKNLQWSDHSTARMIDYIANNLKSSPFLLCLALRPKKGDLGFELPEESTISIQLGELSEDAARDLCLYTLNKSEVPEQMMQAIMSKARGNPLYLALICRSLRETDMIDHLLQVPAFRLADEMSAMEMPDQLQALTMSRIDSLDSATRDLLRIATVIGTTFDVRTLKSVLDASPREAWLSNRLWELENSDFIEHAEDGKNRRYWFKHSLVQEIAYDSLLFARRRQLHRRVALYIEDDHIDNLEPVYEALMHHYSQCCDNIKMRYYGLRAGDKAREMFAHDEAIEYYHRALTTLEGSGRSFNCMRSYFLERIGESYEASGHHLMAARTYSDAARRWAGAINQLDDYYTICSEFCDDQPLTVRWSLLQHKAGAAYERNSDYDAALNRLEAALQRLPPRHPRQTAKIISTKCYALYRMGLYQDAIYWGRLGLSLSRRTGDRNNLAYTYNAIASSYLDTGNIKKAIRYRLLALHLYEELHDLGGQAHTHNNLGVCYQFLDQEKALQHYKSSLAHFKRVKHLANTAICHNNVGEVLLTMGSTNEAIGELKKAVEPYENDDNPPFIFGLALVNLSRAYQRKHEYDMAFECIRQGIRHLKKIGARTILIEAMLQEADIQLDSGNQKAAFLNCQKSLKEAIEIGNTLLQSRGLRLMGRIHCEMRDHTQAEVDLQESIVLAKQAGGYYEEGLSLLCLAKLWRRQGQDETRRYKSAVRRGTAILEKMGAVGDLKKSL